MSKFLIVGLGNIGTEYANTRHNIGFDVLDHIAKDLCQRSVETAHLFAKIEQIIVDVLEALTDLLLKRLKRPLDGDSLLVHCSPCVGRRVELPADFDRPRGRTREPIETDLRFSRKHLA